MSHKASALLSDPLSTLCSATQRPAQQQKYTGGRERQIQSVFTIFTLNKAELSFGLSCGGSWLFACWSGVSFRIMQSVLQNGFDTILPTSFFIRIYMSWPPVCHHFKTYSQQPDHQMQCFSSLSSMTCVNILLQQKKTCFQTLQPEQINRNNRSYDN